MPRTRAPAVAYNTALSQASADKRVDILRLVGERGSISQAARDAGVSYKAAWQAIDTLTNLAGVALVERAVGGAGGGGARLTPAGRQLLLAADALAQARNQVLGQLLAPGTQPVLPLSVRTSMRNQLPCTVQAVEGPGAQVRVHLRLANGMALVSRITRDSAELLALQPGVAVLALCKATAVAVGPVGNMQPAPGCNLLPARATRVARGTPQDGGDEVSAELGPGLALVGFAPSGSGLRAARRVLLRVDESALVLALP